MVVATTGTRLKILKILQERGEASVGQLSSDLDLASATVRRHLDVLLRDRLVDYHQVRKSLGRPEYVYGLTEDGQEILPKHYQDLLSTLLNEMALLSAAEIGECADGRELSVLLFDRMAQKLTSGRVSGSRTERLAVLQEVLEANDFMPEVQTLGNTVTIQLHNCPYRSVAQGYEEVCMLDKKIISNLLDSVVNKAQCIRNGDRACCYTATLSQ